MLPSGKHYIANEEHSGEALKQRRTELCEGFDFVEQSGCRGALQIDTCASLPKKKKKKREFNWENAAFGKFLLKIAYVGTNYSVSALRIKQNRQGFTISC